MTKPKFTTQPSPTRQKETARMFTNTRQPTIPTRRQAHDQRKRH